MATIQDPEKDFAGKGSVPAQVTPDSPQLSSATGSDLDDNYVVYKQYEGEAPAAPAEAKAVLRKIDYRVIGCLFVLYFLQYLDKNGLNYVRLLVLEISRRSADVVWNFVAEFAKLVANLSCQTGKCLGLTRGP